MSYEVYEDNRPVKVVYGTSRNLIDIPDHDATPWTFECPENLTKAFQSLTPGNKYRFAYKVDSDGALGSSAINMAAAIYYKNDEGESRNISLINGEEFTMPPNISGVYIYGNSSVDEATNNTTYLHFYDFCLTEDGSDPRDYTPPHIGTQVGGALESDLVTLNDDSPNAAIAGTYNDHVHLSAHGKVTQTTYAATPAQTSRTIQMNLTAGQPLDVVVNIEATQEGEGEPSPDNVRPIHGVESVSLTVGNRTYSIQLPATSYGGYIDWTRRKYVQTMMSAPVSADYNWSLAGDYIFTPIPDGFPEGKCGTGYCNFLKWIDDYGSDGIFVDGSLIRLGAKITTVSGYTIETFKDMLPELERSGVTPIIVYPLASAIEHDLSAQITEKLIASEGVTTISSDAASVTVNGAQAPSPEHPIEPEFAGGKAKSTGKNLFDLRDPSNHIASTQYVYEKGGMKVYYNGTYGVGETFVFEKLKSGVYSFSCDSSFGGDATEAVITICKNGGYLNPPYYTDANIKKTFSISDGDILSIVFDRWGGGNDTNGWAVFENIQLERGDAVTSYCPYRPPTSITLPTLRAIPDGSGGYAARDELKAVPGMPGWYDLTRNVGVHVVTGEEQQVGEADQYAHQDTTNIAIIQSNIKQSINDLCLCNYTKWDTAHRGVWSTNVQGVTINGNQLHINLLNAITGVTADMTSLEKRAKVTEWVRARYEEGNPVVFWGKAAETTTERIYLGDLKSLPHYTCLETKGNLLPDINVSALTHYDSQVLGLQVDYQNRTFKRLGAAEGKTAGKDFDNFAMYGGRKRCNVANDGTILAYYGDDKFRDDGTNGQVMVYQPAFYYRVEPLVLDPNTTSGIGYHLRKANYYVSSQPRVGFKRHPAFYDEDGYPIDYILMSAYEGSLFDVSENTYIADTTEYRRIADSVAKASEDLLGSVAGVQPFSHYTKADYEKIAHNRGNGWHLENIKVTSANQLLMIVELGTMNTQTGIANGVVSIPDNSTYNCSSITGSTSSLGNGTGQAPSTVDYQGATQTANGKTSITYRGVENPWGNLWKHIQGINIWGDGTMGGGQPYVAEDFTYNERKHDDNYKPVGFTIANANGYVNAMGYGSEEYDWLFMPSEIGGSSALPVGDYFHVTPNLNDYHIALVGGYWHYGGSAGGFSWSCIYSVGARIRSIGGRLVYIPSAKKQQ